MKLLIPLLIFTNLFLSSYTKSLPISPTYEAGVVGINYIATGDPELDIQLSLEQYLNIFSLPAAANLDIIVFSEFTLNTEETAVYVPEPKNRVNPCESKNYGANDLLKILSCAAKKGQTYVVINLTEKANCPDEEMIANQDERQCRPEGVSYYNTNVVFDRNGTVISRYRKFNLFQETVDHPKYPEIVTFSTDFGITFGIFTCFDINFAEPSGSLLRKHKVTDIIFPSFWFSELPHGTGKISLNFVSLLKYYRN
jgi:predicted amidohydrolase